MGPDWDWGPVLPCLVGSTVDFGSTPQLEHDDDPWVDAQRGGC